MIRLILLILACEPEPCACCGGDGGTLIGTHWLACDACDGLGRDLCGERLGAEREAGVAP